jgi:hypothetical protein
MREGNTYMEKYISESTIDETIASPVTTHGAAIPAPWESSSPLDGHLHSTMRSGWRHWIDLFSWP